MNILFLTNEYKNATLGISGGTGNFITNYSKELVKKGHIVHVFGIGSKNKNFSDEGVVVHFEKNLFKKNRFYKLLDSITRKKQFFKKYRVAILEIERKDIAKSVYRYITNQNLKIDLIECHDYNGNSLGLTDTIPYVIRCHGSFSVLKTFGFEAAFATTELEKIAMKKAENFISISKYSEKINESLFEIDKMKLIYNGINSQVFKINKNIKIIPESIFFVGNLSTEKGADIAIEVFKEINFKYPNSSLHLIGIETEYKQEFKKLVIQNNLVSKIHHYGFLQTAEMIDILSAANVVIFPSKGETFGLALCEAMALEKACVCSDLPSFNEIIAPNKNGFIVKSIDDYVHTISTLFNDDNFNKRIGKNARKTIIKQFNMDKMVTESLAYYQEIIDNN